MATASVALYGTGDSNAKKESLDDIIYKIDPDETPFVSSIAKGTASAVTEEFLVQELAAASATNYVNEGADTDYQTLTAHTRFTNVCQISQKGISISGTLMEVDQAGVSDELEYRTVIASKELRRDMEKYLLDGDTAKSSSDPRKTATLETWITNVDDASDATAVTGDGSDVHTAGTGRALTLAQIEAAHQLAWNDGGAPSRLLMSATNKTNFSDLSGNVTNQLQMTAPRESFHIGAVSSFLTDFGQLDVTMDRFLGNDKIYGIDTDWAELRTLPNRNFATNDMARTGDSMQRQIVTEFCLIPTAPKAHFAVHDLNGS